MPWMAAPMPGRRCSLNSDQPVSALVGADLQKRIDLPPAIDVEFFEFDDLHARPRPVIWLTVP